MFVTAVGDVRADNAGMAIQPGYLLAGQVSEVERLRTIATAWEPAGQALLDRLPAGEGLRAVDLGCGPMGWLRLLSRWVGDRGIAIGTDVQADLLDAAAEFARDEGLANTQLVSDDLFNSVLPAQGFDLVHARFELAPIGRAAEQFAAYRRLCKPGGWLIVEDPVSSSWEFYPSAPAAQRLVRMIVKAFADGGGDFDIGRRLPEQFSPAPRARTGAGRAAARAASRAPVPRSGRSPSPRPCAPGSPSSCPAGNWTG